MTPIQTGPIVAITGAKASPSDTATPSPTNTFMMTLIADNGQTYNTELTEDVAAQLVEALAQWPALKDAFWSVGQGLRKSTGGPLSPQEIAALQAAAKRS